MKIVEKYTKIDFHIHSDASVDKDGELVSEGTISNIGEVLVPQLERNKVNMSSITDHNVFSYAHYIELTKYSNVGGHLLKVLPGIELDIEIEDSDKDTHAIAIFDDNNQEKVKNIENIVKNCVDEMVKNKKCSKKQLLFSQAEAIDLFRKIGINFVLIVHQKSDPSNIKVNQEHNAADLGIQKYNELISYDYFDAVEFKNYKVEAFLLAHKKKYNKEYNSLCGSDCHDWRHYPKHDISDTTPFRHCYINALPTFKGLAMALTGDNRIHFTDVAIREPYLKSVSFSITGEDYTVNLSPGLNVLIGDNSIGKSFFLECLNNPSLDKDIVGDPIFNRKIEGYRNFKKKINFIIKSKTLEHDRQNVVFHRQGSVRSLFEGDNKSIEDQPFLAKYFSQIDTRVQETNVNEIIASFLSYSKTISDYNTSKNKIDSFEIVLKPELNIDAYNLSLLVDVDSLNLNNYNQIITTIELSKNNMTNIANNSLLDKDDKETIEGIIEIYDTLIQKYKTKQKEMDLKDSVYSIVVEKINNMIKEIKKKSTDIEKEANSYIVEKGNLVALIADHVLKKEIYNKKSFSLPTEIRIQAVEKTYDKYAFVSKTKKDIITSADLEKMLLSPIKYLDDFSKLKELGIEEICNKLNSDTQKLQYSSNVEKYKAMCINYSKENWFQKEKGAIIDKEASFITGNSAGLNAQYYLDLYTLLENNKLFIIDQPEDDVSEARISKELKTTMRKMADREQIVFVTHNAELVVNLDVDNVIVFKNDSEGKLVISNGALEYEDSSINILNEVAELLDGGAEIIRKRWKRYEKNTNNGNV